MNTLTRPHSTACGVRSFKGKKVYTDYEATVALIRDGKLRVLPDRAGDCFRFAYTAAIRGFGDYVIGTARGKDSPRIYHAVARSKDGRCYYDGTLDACFDVPLYLRLFGWLPIFRMSPAAAREFGRRTGKYPNPVALGFPPLSAVEEEIRSIYRNRRADHVPQLTVSG